MTIGGNRTEVDEDGTSTVYTYNDDQVITAETATYSYDDRGNLETITDGSDVTTYGFDAQNRLESVAFDTTTVSNDYDHDGRRIGQTVNLTETNYLWDDGSRYGDVVLETNSGGNALTSYVLADTRLASQERSGTLHYYLSDGQHSVRALTNASGNITDTYDYTAFGTLYDSFSSTTNSYLYTGQQFDDEIDLYSLRARYYDPANGRFLSKDTWPIDLQNPVELNRYVYTANNPVNLTDPSGLSALKEFGSLVSKIGVSAIKGIRFLVEGTDSPGFFWQALGTLVSGAFQGMAGYITGVYLAKDKDFNSREFAEAAIMGAVINGANALTDRAIMKENSGRFHKHLIPMVVGFGLIVAVAKFIATGMTNILSNFVSLDPDERENTDDATDEGLLYEAITNMLYGYMRYQQGPGQGRPLNANSLYVKFEPYLSLAVGTWGVYEF